MIAENHMITVNDIFFTNRNDLEAFLTDSGFCFETEIYGVEKWIKETGVSATFQNFHTVDYK